jgi:anaerobic selenocysteine-containing dehydrogenase
MAAPAIGTRIVRGACPQDCPDTCAFLYHVENGTLVDVTGDPEHPMTRGGLCVKLNNYAEHHYNPNRLLHPLRRVGPKGSGRYEQITYDEALAEIKRRWTEIIDKYGPQAITNHCYLGNQGTLNGLTSGDAFFNRLGATIGEKCYCESGSSTAWILTVGPTGGLDVESLTHSKYIIVWGMNMISTNLHGWPFILEAKAKGAKVVVIDPVRSRTAKAADWHIPIRPGTDGALALGMMHVIIAEGLVDRDYVDRYTLGYQELVARAAEFPPERVAAITGVPADDIRKLAREYATMQPSAIREGVAIERSPDWIRPGTRVVNELDLGRALTGELGLDPPLMSVFFHNSNPVSQQQNANALIRGLQRDDLFVVVSELFMTDTARYADIILPATLQAEQYDLQVTWGHLYVMLNQRAIDPPGECVPNVEMFRRLAKTMRFDDDYWSMSDDELLTRMYDWSAPALQGITLDKLKEKGWMRLNVGLPHERAPHAQGNFKTPSGKCEFRASAAANGNFVVPVWRNGYTEMQSGEPVDPVPNYIPPVEASGNGESKFPISLLSPKPHAFLNSQYANEPRQQRRQGEQRVLIHPNDATVRGIRDGDYVRVYNDRGAFEGEALLSDDVMEGMAVANLGHWPSLTRTGSAVNSTTSSRHSNLGGAGTQSDNRVEIARI